MLLKKTLAPDQASDVDDEAGRRDAMQGIRCPLCAWRPAQHDLWSCIGPDGTDPFAGCGAEWNTFSTRGRCPGCSHQWRWTSCLQCDEWSLHEDWYEAVD